jgi:hypothetical protein
MSVASAQFMEPRKPAIVKLEVGFGTLPDGSDGRHSDAAANLAQQVSGRLARNGARTAARVAAGLALGRRVALDAALVAPIKPLQGQTLTQDQLLMKVGAAKKMRDAPPA